MRRLVLPAALAAVLMALLAIPAARLLAGQGGDYTPSQQTVRLDGQQRQAAAGELPPAAAPKPFSHIMLRWVAAMPKGSALTIEVRASADGGQSWSDWRAVEEDDDLWQPSDGPDVHWSQIVDVGAVATHWQLRTSATPAEDGSSPQLTQIDVNTVNTAEEPAAPAGRAAPQSVAPTADGLSRPPVVSRAEWGSPDGEGSRAAPAYYRVNHMVVHHTADPSTLYPSEPNWGARVRAIWSYHAITRGWGDIGYNYLVDPNGVVYEGRAGGDDAVAFHDTANYGSMGVALLGTYSASAPSAAMQDTLVRLLAWKAQQRGIDPGGSSYYYGCTISSYCLPYHAGGIVLNLAGHREVTPNHTSCPGDATIDIMPSVRTRVRQLLDQGAPPQTQLQLTGVQFARTTVAAGELLEVHLTVRNVGDVTAVGQSPQVDLASADAFSAYAYRDDECFNSDPAGTSPAYPKESGRVRVALGTPTWDADHPGRCSGATSNYPWRWGLNGDLAPGAERTVIGFVQFRSPGSYTVQAGLVQEYVGYLAQGAGATTITVTPERTMPEAAAYDDQLRPLAHAYRLADVPDNLLARTADPGSLLRAGYIGSFAWGGEPLDWGAGGPFGVADHFAVVQSRSFVAQSSGAYTFRIASDDGGWLLVDGRVVAAAPGLHPVQSATGSVQLSAGPHTLGVVVFDAAEGAYAAYDYQPPGGDFQLIPDAVSSQPHDGLTFTDTPSLALAADDLGGSGVQKIRWSLNGGPWQEQPGALLQTGRLQRGTYVLSYAPVDAAGNSGATRTLRFGVQAAAPPMPEGAYKAYMPSISR